ncbi:MAG: succinyl-diaminopimelate desuccinylase [Micavibrio sp.]|nr:succinyl-diaminopimelate desuccinylase [Micavibrio sp.]
MCMSVIELTQKLIACASVTPKDEGAQVLLKDFLENLGFECHCLEFGEGGEAVPNLFARLGTDGPHLCYAGHTDVVPAGDDDAWTYGAFTPHIQDGVLYGRGSSDMKGSVAAFASAVAQFVKSGVFKGSISMLITGDEEGPSINGTVRVLEWMKENGHVPDVALVGEPTNPDHLGQEIKIGRRGSLSGSITVSGKQGHVAYQHLAENPLPALVKLLDALANHRFDEGNAFFPPTNLEITTIDVGNQAENVIPASGKAVFNVRFNDKWSKNTLSEAIKRILDAVGNEYELELWGNAESFMTEPGHWTEVVRDAVGDVVDAVPAYTTNGGTSDARFITNYCPVVECGAINASIHQVDENARVEDLENLEKIYVRILERYFNV